jgi:hypothetical protein
MLFPALGAAVDNWLNAAVEAWKRRATKIWLYLSAACCAFVFVVLQLHAATGFWTFYGPKYWAAKFGEDDPTLEGLDYDALREFLAQRGWLDNDRVFLAATRWYDAGNMAWAARGARPGLAMTDDPRNVAYLYPQTPLLGKDAVLMARYAGDDEVKRLTNGVFASVEKLPDLIITRGGRPELRLRMYYCRNLRRAYKY